MQSGSSSYKCVKCVKRPDRSTVQLASAVDTADTPPEGPEAFSELAGSACGSVSPNVMTLMQKMVTQIDALTFEVRQLRAENVTLRVEIRDLRECVVGQTDFPPLRYAKQPAALAPPAQSFACVAATGPGFSGDGTRSQPSSSSAQGHPPLSKSATFGTAKHCTLQVAPKSLAARCLFLSRLAPSTKASDVQELLAGLVGDKTVDDTVMAEWPNFESMRNIMYREKTKLQPSLPRNMAEANLGSLYTETLDKRGFLVYDISTSARELSIQEFWKVVQRY
ncbi:hypothetical protein HPB47_013320 [Ixodes persulcatus]|uniref:Uncharacterized protein n=1 Tax=Ixodes persulcatus TaxID=34615 RepID=A0AC60R0I7_IXOPE|nr:hypothetical protein HPB47_013320 [Ixodes persulcatus]